MTMSFEPALSQGASNGCGRMTARTALPWLCALRFVPLVPSYGLRGEDGMRFSHNPEAAPGRYWGSAMPRPGLQYGLSSLAMGLGSTGADR